MKATLAAYSTLQPTSRSTTSSRTTTSDSKTTTTTGTGDSTEWKKRIKRVIGGLRNEDKDKVTTHIKAVLKWKQGGCFIHDHKDHTQAKCKKLKDL